MQGNRGKRTIRMTFSEAEYESLREVSGRYGFAYPAKFAKASIRIIMDRLESVEYVYGSPQSREDEIREVFQDYSDWQSTSEHVFGPDVRERK